MLLVQVCHQPKVYVYDTPGIMPPKINNVEVGLKLALCCKYNHSLWSTDLFEQVPCTFYCKFSIVVT